MDLRAKRLVVSALLKNPSPQTALNLAQKPAQKPCPQSNVFGQSTSYFASSKRPIERCY
jgi:hypothetical protein